MCNHCNKFFRQIDFNQINVNQGRYLQDFINARNNGLASSAVGKGFNPAFNSAIPGSVPLPFFSSLPNGGLLSNASVRSNIISNQVGSLGQFYQLLGSFPNNQPGFSFFPNPLTLYSSELSNYTNSSYNGLSVQARRRTRSGLQLQASYVYSKAFSDTSVERGLDAILDNNNPRIERARAPWDLTHSFKLNHYFPLPAGDGHRFSYHPSNRVIPSSALSAFLTLQPAAPSPIPPCPATHSP